MPRPSHKNRILDEGAGLILRRGYTACGVAEIAEVAGVPKGSFYNHFESKEAFGLAVLDRFAEQSEAAGALHLADETRPPRARLDAYFGALIESHAQHGFAEGCPIGNFVLEAGCTSETIRARLGTIFGAWSASLARVIAASQAAGEIRSTASPEALADFCIHAWEGAVLRMKVERSAAPLERCKAMLFASVLV